MKDCINLVMSIFTLLSFNRLDIPNQSILKLFNNYFHSFKLIPTHTDYKQYVRHAKSEASRLCWVFAERVFSLGEQHTSISSYKQLLYILTI